MPTPFDVIGEPARRELLDLLRRDGPSSVNELVVAAGLSQPSTSRHLRALREAGLVTVTPHGRSRVYEVRLEGVVELAQWLTPYLVMEQRSR